MLRKFLTGASVVAFGCLMFSGCRQPGNCRNGSCSAPSAGYGSMPSTFLFSWKTGGFGTEFAHEE